MHPGDPGRPQVATGDLEQGLGAANRRPWWGAEGASPSWDPGGRPGERS